MEDIYPVGGIGQRISLAFIEFALILSKHFPTLLFDWCFFLESKVRDAVDYYLG